MGRLAALAVLLPAAAANTCGELKSQYREADCCGSEQSTPLPLSQAAVVPQLPFLQSELSEFNPVVEEPPYFPDAKSGPKLADEFGGTPGFYHSVASGSPTSHSVIIWTRYTPATADEKVEVVFMMAEGTDPAALAAAPLHGTAIAEPGHDWVVKLDITGLKPGTSYVYGFSAGGTSSRVGHTKTAPPEGWTGDMTYAVFACSRWENGYFHAYDIVSSVKDLDFWVHTGDYLYEYGSGYSAARQMIIDPPWEIVRVGDYRRRHALYVEDAGLAKLRATAPMVAMWDDHEFTNNPYGKGMGADNHQPVCDGNHTHPGNQCREDEGDFLVRANNAAQVYFEWLPVRRGPNALSGKIDTDLTQVVEWGSVATIMMQDSRIVVRPEHGTIGLFAPDYAASPFSIFTAAIPSTDVKSYTAEDFAEANALMEAEVTKEEYELVGAEQRKDLEETFAASKAAGKPWQIYGASVVMPDQIGPGSLYKLADAYPEQAAALNAYIDAVYANPNLFHAMVGFEFHQQGWNADSWTGFKNEREKMYEIFKEKANNVVVLSGDVHDCWAYEMQNKAGDPVGINIVAGGVTANGWGPFAPTTGLGPEGYNLFEESWLLTDPKLKYAGVKDKGFWVNKANMTHHISEVYMINTDDIAADPTNSKIALTPFEEYAPGKAPYYCDSSLVTMASEPGKLKKSVGCEIKFETEASMRRRTTEKAPVVKHAFKPSCDCLFLEKLGQTCACVA